MELATDSKNRELDELNVLEQDVMILNGMINCKYNKLYVIK
jgi:hypothetical protein